MIWVAFFLPNVLLYSICVHYYVYLCMDCLDVGIHVDTALSAETIYIFYDI